MSMTALITNDSTNRAVPEMRLLPRDVATPLDFVLEGFEDVVEGE